MLTHSKYTNPVITGASVHNQRIERLWRDVFRCVLSVFYQLFYHLEEMGKLDPLSEVDLYCLHVVYRRKINEALNAFRSGWNSHAITTEHSMTPEQLFTLGTLLDARPDGCQSTSGISDSDGGDSDDSQATVAVPNTPIPLNQTDAHELERLVTEARESENYSIEIYDLVRQFVHDRVQ